MSHWPTTFAPTDPGAIDSFEVGELLASLTDKSLVVRDHETGRYRLLETVGDYARILLASVHEVDEMRRRHLDYYVTLAEEAEPHLKGSDQQAWLDRLDVEHDNIRAAIEWSTRDESDEGLRLGAAVWRYWYTRSYFGEGRACLGEILDHVRPGQRTADRARALSGAGTLAYLQGDHEAARARYDEALQIRRELGDQRDIAASLNNLGNVAYLEGDYAAARAVYEESLQVFRELADSRNTATLLNNLALVAHDRGEYATARALLEESLRIRRELSDRLGIATSLSNLGNVTCDEGDYVAARALHEESLQIQRELGDRLDIAYSMEGLAATGSDSAWSAHLWGAAERLRDEIGAPIPLNDRPRYERYIVAARAALGNDAAFDGAWQEGRAISLEQAIELALTGGGFAAEEGQDFAGDVA